MVKTDMEMTEKESRELLDKALIDCLYEIDLCGHKALIGKEGYIEYLLRGCKIDKMVMEFYNDKNMTNL
jgi:hypothetical protein